MIQKFEIENFRGHKSLSMKGITPLTLITGMNNVGKSSFLEAVFLLHDHTDPNVFSKLGGLRGVVNDSIIKLWEPLFYQNNLDYNMVLSLSEDDGTESKLTYMKDVDFAPVMAQNIDTNQQQNPNMMVSQFGVPIKLPYSIKYEYYHEDYKEYGNFNFNGIGLYSNISTSLPNNDREKMPWTLYINSSTVRVAQDVMEWIGNLEINEKKDMAINVLKMIAPDTKDIFSASQNGQTQLYIKNKNGVIPLKYAGDGLIRLLYITSAILTNKNSLILIDEIENGFHYSMYSKIWEVLAKIAHDNSCQIIATTHSYEQIAESLLGVKQAGREYDYSLHRFERYSEMTKDNCYDFEMAETAVNAKMEVR